MEKVCERIPNSKKTELLVLAKKWRAEDTDLRPGWDSKAYSIAPRTSKEDSYCARSYGQMKKHPKVAKNPNSHYACPEQSGSVTERNRGDRNGKRPKILFP